MSENKEEYKPYHDRNSRFALDDARRVVEQGDMTNAVERYLAMENEEQSQDYSSRLHFFLQHAAESDKHGDILYKIFESLLDDTKHRRQVVVKIDSYLLAIGSDKSEEVVNSLNLDPKYLGYVQDNQDNWGRLKEHQYIQLDVKRGTSEVVVAVRHSHQEAMELMDPGFKVIVNH